MPRSANLSIAKRNLLKLIKILLKIVYAQEPSVRKFCDAKRHADLPNKSGKYLLRNIKLILSNGSLKTLRKLCVCDFVEKCANDEVMLFLGKILRKTGLS